MRRDQNVSVSGLMITDAFISDREDVVKHLNVFLGGGAIHLQSNEFEGSGIVNFVRTLVKKKNTDQNRSSFLRCSASKDVYFKRFMVGACICQRLR